MDDFTGVIKNGMYISMKKEDSRIIENEMDDLITGVIKNGMYISMKKEDFRIIENDMQLFRSNPEAEKKTLSIYC